MPQNAGVFCHPLYCQQEVVSEYAQRLRLFTSIPCEHWCRRWGVLQWYLYKHASATPKRTCDSYQGCTQPSQRTNMSNQYFSYFCCRSFWSTPTHFQQFCYCWSSTLTATRTQDKERARHESHHIILCSLFARYHVVISLWVVLCQHAYCSQEQPIYKTCLRNDWIFVSDINHDIGCMAILTAYISHAKKKCLIRFHSSDRNQTLGTSFDCQTSVSLSHPVIPCWPQYLVASCNQVSMRHSWLKIVEQFLDCNKIGLQYDCEAKQHHHTDRVIQKKLCDTVMCIFAALMLVPASECFSTAS